MASLTEREAIRRLLLEGESGGQFDDDHTSDAYRLAKVAEIVGLTVTYDEHGNPQRMTLEGADDGVES